MDVTLLHPDPVPTPVIDQSTERCGMATTMSVPPVAPKLRGWLHAGAVPVVLVAGTLLVLLSPTGASRLGSSIFAAAALANFAVSAAMHRGRWPPRTALTLRRLDHASIFLVIAGTYTPFAVLMLTGEPRILLLSITWTGATLGVCFRLYWADAPRWFFTLIYLALGWAAIFFIGDFLAYPGSGVLALIALGGVLYTAGAVTYGLRRPNPFPTWFGFHEVFHTLTIAAFVSHYVGVSIIIYSLH
jgi:hemolysin III